MEQSNSKILLVGYYNNSMYIDNPAYICDNYAPFDIIDFRMHIDSINPSAIIYIYTEINIANYVLYTIYETYFDTINDKYRLFKVNGNDNPLNVHKCIQSIQKNLENDQKF